MKQDVHLQKLLARIIPLVVRNKNLKDAKCSHSTNQSISHSEFVLSKKKLFSVTISLSMTKSTTNQMTQLTQMTSFEIL